MKVIVIFDRVRVVVPCNESKMKVYQVQEKAVTRYKKIMNKGAEHNITIHNLAFFSDGGILNSDDDVIDVIEDKDKLVAIFSEDGDQNESLNNFLSSFEEQGAQNESVSSNSSSNKDDNKSLWQRGSTYQQSFGKGRLQKTPQITQRETFNRLNPANFHDNQLPWFYQQSSQVSISISEDHPLGLKVESYEDPESGSFCGLIITEVTDKNLSHILQADDVIVEINQRILINYSYEISKEKLFESRDEIHFRILFANHVTSNHVTSNHVTSNHVTSNHVTSNHVTSNHVTSNHMTFNHVTSANSNSSNNLSTSSHDHLLRHADDRENPETIKLRNQQIVEPTKPFSSIQPLFTRKIGNCFTVRLQKGTSGLGFSITTRDTNIGIANPIYVKNILASGAAVRDGRLRPGDRLLKVNEVEMSGIPQESAVELLRQIPVNSVVELLISRQKDFLPREMKIDEEKIVMEKNSIKTNLKFEIALNDTGSAGLGISVKGNQNRKTGKGQGIFIKGIFHGGAVWQDGRLQVNDQLIEVNNHVLVGKSNDEALQILRNSMLTEGNQRGMIQVVVARRSGDVSKNDTSSCYTSSNESDIFDSTDQHVTNLTTVEGLTSQLDFFKRDLLARQSISEKRRRYIATDDVIKSAPKAKKEVMMMKSNSMESVIVEKPTPRSLMKSRNITKSMEDLLDNFQPLQLNTNDKKLHLKLDSVQRSLDGPQTSVHEKRSSKNSRKIFQLLTPKINYIKPKLQKEEKQEEKYPITPRKLKQQFPNFSLTLNRDPQMTSSPSYAPRYHTTSCDQTINPSVTKRHENKPKYRWDVPVQPANFIDDQKIALMTSSQPRHQVKARPRTVYYDDTNEMSSRSHQQKFYVVQQTKNKSADIQTTVPYAL